MLKYEIVRRVGAGETMGHVCAQPGMPCVKTVWHWRRSDPAFAAELEAAQARRRWWRHWRFDDARAGAFLARLRAGERLDSILGDPAMPSRQAFTGWLSQAPFAEDVWRIKQERLRDTARRNGAASRRPFDRSLADRILLRVGRGGTLRAVLNADPDLPSLTTLRDWRRAEPAFDGGLRFAMQVGRRARARARAVAWQETLTARIREGASLASLGREADTPSKATLYRWAGKHPEFAREIAQACDDRQHWYLDQIAEIAEAVTPGTVKETRRRMSPLTRRLGQLSQRPGKKWLG